MKTLTGKFFPAQLVVLFAAVLCLLPLNTVHAASDSNWLSQIISGMQPVIQPMLQSGQPQPVQPMQPMQPMQHQATSGTCNARYEVVVTDVNGRSMNQVIPFGEFQSHGKGRMPTKAAMHAKQSAERCMQTQWHGRQSGMIPHECRDQQRISGYHIQDFQETLNQEICQALQPLPCDRGAADIRYSIFSVVDGESGCGSRMSTASRTLLDSGVLTQCQCRDGGHDRGRDGGRERNHERRQMTAPQQVSPAQGTVFYHIPRRTLVAWQPVPRARSYVVEIKYNGRLWTTLNATDETTFATFDFPGSGQGEWRVMAEGRRGMNGTASPWSSFQYQR
jgi:hypothetical protein